MSSAPRWPGCRRSRPRVALPPRWFARESTNGRTFGARAALPRGWRAHQHPVDVVVARVGAGPPSSGSAACTASRGRVLASLNTAGSFMSFRRRRCRGRGSREQRAPPEANVGRVKSGKTQSPARRDHGRAARVPHPGVARLPGRRRVPACRWIPDRGWRPCGNRSRADSPSASRRRNRAGLNVNDAGRPCSRCPARSRRGRRRARKPRATSNTRVSGTYENRHWW